MPHKAGQFVLLAAGAGIIGGLAWYLVKKTPLFRQTVTDPNVLPADQRFTNANSPSTDQIGTAWNPDWLGGGYNPTGKSAIGSATSAVSGSKPAVAFAKGAMRKRNQAQRSAPPVKKVGKVLIKQSGGAGGSW